LSPGPKVYEGGTGILEAGEKVVGEL